eukprot:MONOS_12111.1-p1 / transcript=MONOS_12111.1 / gene=MONOS_12111 / organism=Monocercomonoides_exilis_PA203 / gene_product=unspecified product / transcript_product=unspecified product / location=Mono_scaffold00646:32308-35416(+) / protein_length=925 / sequence_SO=supercontig / SO=protein_coding / is_pseudo=false
MTTRSATPTRPSSRAASPDRKKKKGKGKVKGKDNEKEVEKDGEEIQMEQSIAFESSASTDDIHIEQKTKVAKTSRIIAEISSVIGPRIVGMPVTNLLAIDKVLEDMGGLNKVSGTTGWELHPLSLFITSLAVAKAGAARLRIPLFVHLCRSFNTIPSLPAPSLAFFVAEQGDQLNLPEGTKESKKEKKDKEKGVSAASFASDAEIKQGLEMIRMSFGNMLGVEAKEYPPLIPKAEGEEEARDLEKSQKLGAGSEGAKSRPPSSASRAGEAKKKGKKDEKGRAASPTQKKRPASRNGAKGEKGDKSETQSGMAEDEKDEAAQPVMEYSMVSYKPPPISDQISLFSNIFLALKQNLALPTSAASSLLQCMPLSSFASFEEVFEAIALSAEKAIPSFVSSVSNKLLSQSSSSSCSSSHSQLPPLRTTFSHPTLNLRLHLSFNPSFVDSFVQKEDGFSVLSGWVAKRNGDPLELARTTRFAADKSGDFLSTSSSSSSSAPSALSTVMTSVESLANCLPVPQQLSGASMAAAGTFWRQALTSLNSLTIPTLSSLSPLPSLASSSLNSTATTLPSQVSTEQSPDDCVPLSLMSLPQRECPLSDPSTSSASVCSHNTSSTVSLECYFDEIAKLPTSSFDPPSPLSSLSASSSSSDISDVQSTASEQLLDSAITQTPAQGINSAESSTSDLSAFSSLPQAQHRFCIEPSRVDVLLGTFPTLSTLFAQTARFSQQEKMRMEQLRQLWSALSEQQHKEEEELLERLRAEEEELRRKEEEAAAAAAAALEEENANAEEEKEGEKTKGKTKKGAKAAKEAKEAKQPKEEKKEETKGKAKGKGKKDKNAAEEEEEQPSVNILKLSLEGVNGYLSLLQAAHPPARICMVNPLSSVGDELADLATSLSAEMINLGPVVDPSTSAVLKRLSEIEHELSLLS